MLPTCGLSYLRRLVVLKSKLKQTHGFQCCCLYSSKKGGYSHTLKMMQTDFKLSSHNNVFEREHEIQKVWYYFLQLMFLTIKKKIVLSNSCGSQLQLHFVLYRNFSLISCMSGNQNKVSPTILFCTMDLPMPTDILI